MTDGETSDVLVSVLEPRIKEALSRTVSGQAAMLFLSGGSQPGGSFKIKVRGEQQVSLQVKCKGQRLIGSSL